MNTKPKRSRMSAEEIRRAVELYKAGGTFKAIGEALGRSAYAVRHNVKDRTTLRVRRKQKHYHALTVGDIRRAVEARAQGVTVAEIAWRIGCSERTIYKHLRKLRASA